MVGFQSRLEANILADHHTGIEHAPCMHPLLYYDITDHDVLLHSHKCMSFKLTNTHVCNVHVTKKKNRTSSHSLIEHINRAYINMKGSGPIMAIIMHICS